MPRKTKADNRATVNRVWNRRVLNALDLIDLAQKLIHQASGELHPVPGYGAHQIMAENADEAIDRYYHAVRTTKEAREVARSQPRGRR